MRTFAPSTTRSPHVAFLYAGLAKTLRISAGTAPGGALERAATTHAATAIKPIVRKATVRTAFTKLIFQGGLSSPLRRSRASIRSRETGVRVPGSAPSLG